MFSNIGHGPPCLIAVHFFTTAISNLWRMAVPWHFMVNTAAQNVGFLAFRIRNQ
jgi:hypothetical protein